MKHARHAVKPEYIELSQSTLIWNNKLTEVAMLVLSKKIFQKLGEKLLTMAMKNKLLDRAIALVGYNLPEVLCLW